MKYIYYPGCSAEATGKPFEESLLEVLKLLELPFEELHQWNCCGATAYMSIDELKAFALAARNLALAEKQGLTATMETVDLFTSCAACYLVLLKTHKYIKEYPEINDKIAAALSRADLQYGGGVRVRHALDLLINDIGIDRISKQVRKPLADLRVACYYGCQIVRPYALFDDIENPSSMDRLIQLIGAEAVDWPMKTRCCGGSLMGTIPDVGLRLNHIILREAQKHGADVIATACPLCQFNLECYQDKIVKQVDRSFARIPVVFFTQLLGLAFGINERKLGIRRLFMPIKAQWKIGKGGHHVRPGAARK